MRSPESVAQDAGRSPSVGKIGPILLSLLATATLHASVWSHQPSWHEAGPLLQLAALCLVLLVWRPFWGSKLQPAESVRHAGLGKAHSWRESKWFTAWGWFALVTAPWLTDGLSRTWSGPGNLPEVLLAFTLQNLIWGQLWIGSSTPLVLVSSLFLVMYSFLWSTHVVTTVLVVLFGIVAVCHLAARCWQRLHPHRPLTTVEFSGQQMSLFWTTVGLLMLTPLLLWQSAIASTSGWPGWLPSSGGQGAADFRAMRGIGSGDQLVAAEHDAMSFGPIETDLFIESEMPTLYDAYNESYEPPVPKRLQSTRRAIPLAPNDVRTSHQQRATNQSASREFSVHRQPRGTMERPEDVHVAALFHVQGRIPVHLGVETFNHWDGANLSHVPDSEPLATPVLDPPDNDGRRWLTLRPAEDLKPWERAEQHTLRIANLRTARVPGPPRMHRLLVDRLSDAGVFRIEDDGQAAYCGDHLPQLTVLHIESRSIRRNQCAAIPVYRRQTLDDDSGDQHVARLARQWSAASQPGWPQIDAIVQGLRLHATVDPRAVVPPSTADAVDYFLGTSRKGSDYLFATAAALMFRQLGYESRVVSGFYASLKGHNPISGQTAVTSDDVHFWTEVRLIDGSWAAVDATPGYEQPFAAPSWPDFWQQCWTTVARSVRRHAIGLTFGLAIAAWSVVRRRRVLSLLALAWNALPRPGRSLRGEVSQTLWLIEAMALWHGQGRPVQQAWGRWLNGRRDWFAEPTQADPAGLDRHLTTHEWSSVVQWALYSPQAPCPLDETVVRRACRSLPWNVYWALARRSWPHPAADPNPALRT
ncbi:MAG: transglutaminase-like domain-containing protein [Pirellulales bacterium]